MTRMVRTGLVLGLAIAMLLAVTRSATAQVNAGVLFLRIAPGARAAGMGEAFVAMADDATATHWNPAGLGTYPLNSEWSEFALNTNGQVSDAVPLKNGLPGDHYDAYDLWILTDDGLGVFRLGESGMTAGTIELPTDNVRSIAAAIRRYAPFLSEGEADDIARNAAAGTVGIPASELQDLTDRIKAAIPEGYRDRTIIENLVRELGVAHREGRIIEDRFSGIRDAVNNLPDSDPADGTQLDRVRFALEHGIAKVLPSTIHLRVNEIISPPVRAIAGDGDNLYVASGHGLLQFDGRRWTEVTAPDGIEWETTTVNTIAVASGRRMWVGTNEGIFVRHSGQWQKLGANEGLPPGRVTKLGVSRASTGWVYGDFGLAHYDGSVFSVTDDVPVNVDDDLTSIMERYLGTDDQVASAAATEKVRDFNGLSDDHIPDPGSTIRIPYALGLRGNVTVLAADSYGRLWVGTDLGTFRYANNEWRSYGYEAVHVEEATTAQAIAEQRLGRYVTPERTERLARYIRDYNGLNDDNIEAGRTVYVYRNPAGAPVNAIASSGDGLLIASEVGQLQVKSDAWSRYYHASLDHDNVRAIAATGGDVWFVCNDRVVVFQRATKELSLMHAPWLPEFNLDLYFEYLAYVTNLEGLGTIGVAITFLSYGEIPRLDEFGSLINSFHSFDGALSVSYGTRLSPNLAAGLSAKVIYSRLADQGAGQEIGSGSATAYALDAGFQYRTPWRRLTLGGALTNVGPDISYIDAQQSDPLPRNLALGFAYRILDSPFHRFTVVGDLNKELVDLGDGASDEFKQIIYNTGLEYWYMSTIAGRFGYINDEDGQIKTITVGIGLVLRNLRLDVGYIPSQDNLPLANTVRYSFTGRF